MRMQPAAPVEDPATLPAEPKPSAPVTRPKTPKPVPQTPAIPRTKPATLPGRCPIRPKPISPQHE
jgi:hypothetical protein